MRWIDITQQEPEFFQPPHQDFRETIQVTKPVFIFDQCYGVMPAMGHKEGNQKWWHQTIHSLEEQILHRPATRL